VFVRMVGLGHKPTLAEAKRRFALHLTGEKIIHADVKPAVYRAVIADGEDSGYEALVEVSQPLMKK
jgi:Ni,Fe-hydrogenase III large subunit